MKRKKIDHGQSVRIRTDIVGIAREVASSQGRTMRSVLEEPLVEKFIESKKNSKS